jgi:hypothetical protein
MSVLCVCVWGGGGQQKKKNTEQEKKGCGVAVVLSLSPLAGASGCGESKGVQAVPLPLGAVHIHPMEGEGTACGDFLCG